MKPLSLFFIFLAVSSVAPLVAAAPDFVIFNDWIEPGNFIIFNQFKLRVVEIIPGTDENSTLVTIELTENNNRLMYDILKINQSKSPHADIKIQFNSIYTSQNLKMAKIAVHYKTDDQYVSRSWEDISDTVNQNELVLLKSDGLAGILQFDGSTMQDRTIILKNYGSQQVNNLIAIIDFPSDPSLEDDFIVSLPKTFLGSNESINITVSFLSSKKINSQTKGTLTIKNNSYSSIMPILIGGGTTNNDTSNDPFNTNPFTSGSTVQVFTFYQNTHLPATNLQVEPNTQLIFYSYNDVSFTFQGAKLQNTRTTYNSKPIYFVQIPTNTKGSYSVSVGGQNFNVQVGQVDNEPQYQKGLLINVTPEKDKYKSGDKITLTVGSTEAIAFPEAIINFSIGSMNFNVKSGSTIEIPDFDQETVTVQMSTNYPNYGSAQRTIIVDNSIGLIQSLGTLALFVLVPGVIVFGLIKFLKAKPKEGPGPSPDKLKKGLQGLG